MKTFPWSSVAHRLDNREAYGRLVGSPWFPDAEYATFSAAEFERRYAATRAKMARLGIDVLLAPGGPHHWSFGGGMLWLSGHWNWHAAVEYVVVPAEGEPALIYSQVGAHVEATRRAAYPTVYSARGGKFSETIAEFLISRGLQQARIGIAESDWQFHEYVPVNHVEKLSELLPQATIELIPHFFHELMYLKSAEERLFVKKAGDLCVQALLAIRDRARPGVTEYELKAAAAKAILEDDGIIDFLIIGSTPMDRPAQVFGNPRPSHRVLKEGDIILNELAAGYQGYTAQIGIPICVGEPTPRVRQFFDEVVLPGFLHMERTLYPGGTLKALQESGKFFRDHGAQSRPILLHGIDLVSNSPHVGLDELKAYEYEQVMKPGACLMLEPCPITADGCLGMFYGHTYIVTEDGAECMTSMPHELLVARW